MIADGIEFQVATFRADGAYIDGRRPEDVTFTTAEGDAQRRDFTVNGLFYDPIEERVIDFVGGEEDLKRGVIRAIGDPGARFAEDKLRLLRAVRFAATLGFSIIPETWTPSCALPRRSPSSARNASARSYRKLSHHPHESAVGIYSTQAD